MSSEIALASLDLFCRVQKSKRLAQVETSEEEALMRKQTEAAMCEVSEEG